MAHFKGYNYITLAHLCVTGFSSDVSLCIILKQWTLLYEGTYPQEWDTSNYYV